MFGNRIAKTCCSFECKFWQKGIDKEDPEVLTTSCGHGPWPHTCCYRQSI